jgi:hypothetical protein
MNVIPFVFAILLILSYGMAASLQGRLLSHRNQRAYVALRGAELDILRKSEKRQFKSLSGDVVQKERDKRPPKAKNSSKPKAAEEPDPPELNAPCARLNLHPLIAEGRDLHPALYETAAKMLRIFYQKQFFPTEKRFEYKILDAILAGAKIKIGEKSTLALETIALQDPSFQPLYYAFLKGTKKVQLSEVGHPPLIDYWKIEKEKGKICLFHCHPDMLTVFFGFKTAPKLYEELHDKTKKTILSLEEILEWAGDPQLGFTAKEVWDLIDFKRPQHADAMRQTMLGAQDGVTIRKNVSLKPTQTVNTPPPKNGSF